MSAGLGSTQTQVTVFAGADVEVRRQDYTDASRVQVRVGEVGLSLPVAVAAQVLAGLQRELGGGTS